MRKYYIYGLKDPVTNEIRYIGKTWNPEKRLYSHLKDKSKTHKTNWIKSLLIQNLKPILFIISEVNEEEACYQEKYYIKFYKEKGNNLTNSTEGGEDGRLSPDIIKKRTETRKNTAIKKGYWFTPETLKKMSLSHKGKKKTKTSILKQSLKLKEKTYIEIYGEEKARLIIKKKTGQKRTLETRKKISKALTGRKQTEKTKKN